VATRRRTPGDVVGLSEQRSEDAHDAQEDDDPDDDDGDQKEDQKPKATAVTLSHDDHLRRRWWGCLAHSESLSASVNRVVVRQRLFVAGWRASQSWQTVIRVRTQLRPCVLIINYLSPGGVVVLVAQHGNQWSFAFGQARQKMIISMARTN
jgi:hypothetical protein